MITERAPICNHDTYGLTKLLAQDIVQQQGAITAYILRLPGVLGDGASSPWLVRQIQKAIRNETIEIYNAGAPFNNAVWVGDLCHFVYDLLKKSFTEHQLFLLGAAGKMSIGELIDLIIQKTGSKSRIKNDEGKGSFILDSTKAREGNYESRSIKDMVLEQIEIERRKFQ